ncbi:MAG TPA: hypothetical protein VIJ22_17660 [Polyangiaceae bacterium]
MKPRALGGCIGRADAIFVWVPYAEVEYEDEPEEPEVGADGLVEVGEVLDTEDEPDPGDPEEEYDDEPEEIGLWMAVTKVQARELVADACTSEIEDLEIEATEAPTGLYIGLGPVP